MGQQQFVRGDRRPRPAVQDIRAHAPYDNCVERYLEAGWFPLPAGGEDLKQPIESGYSGWKNDFKKKATKKSARELLARRKGQGLNIALWIPPGIIAIDVDAYKQEGAQSIAALQAEFGKLPDTIISSARADGTSGIRYYRIPLDVDLHGIGIIGDGIEAVHRGTRIAVVPPSYHVGVEGHYKWYLPGQEIDGNGSFDVPEIGDVVDLSPAWVDMLRNHKHARFIPQKKLPGGVSGARKLVDAWVEKHNGTPCAKMIRAADAIAEALEAKVQRHDNAQLGSYHLCCLAAEGHPGLDTVLEDLCSAFAESRKDDEDRPTTRNEWLRFIDGGVRMVMTREDNNEFTGSACTCAALGADGRPRPDLNINEIDLPVAIPECYKAMAARPETGWHGAYRNGGDPVIVDEDGMHELDPDTLREVIMNYVNCYRLSVGDEPRMIPQAPGTPFLASMVKSWSGIRNLPELKAIVHAPFYAYVGGEEFADGRLKPKLIHSNGYHADAGVYLKLDESLGVTIENMKEVPDDKLPWAKRWIDKAIKDFPFKNPGADRAAFYAALILPFVRDLIKGPTPLHLIGAPSPRTGKTLLCDAISLIVCGELSGAAGRQMISIGKGKDRIEKMEKAITAAMRTLPRVIVLDNISGMLDSPDLASALTNDVYTGRVLGESRNLDDPNRTLWMATGNNIQASSEIQERIVPCWLDDEGRQRNPSINLREYIPENRARLVWSVLTLVSNWVHQGCPPPPSEWRPLRGYEAWGRVIGGILYANGIKGLLSNVTEFREGSTDDGHSLVELFEAWEDRYGLGVKVKAREALGALELARELVDTSKGNAASMLGWILNSNKDVPHGKYVLRRVTMQKVNYYRLELVGQPTRVRRGRKPKNRPES